MKKIFKAILEAIRVVSIEILFEKLNFKNKKQFLLDNIFYLDTEILNEIINERFAIKS